ncbi:MAG: hypothetical protein J6D16_05675, partial [Clostridia bacterium]|nr:hypothetical protein [Clostridia bacterium]
IQGDDGNQMYVRFSAYADGTDMSEKWDAERNFMGIAFAYETPTEKEQYQWISLADISLGHYAEEGSEDKYLFFVGNGTGEDNRSNALTLDAEGVMWLLKDLLIGEGRVSVAETFNSFEKRFKAAEKKEADFEKSFWWNVDTHVGAISPSISTSLSDNVTQISPQTVVFSIPMINAGSLYVDFDSYIYLDTKIDRDRVYVVTVNIEIYVNNIPIETYTHEFKDWGFGEDTKHFRQLLHVDVGDSLTLKATASRVLVGDDYVYTGDAVKFSINNIRFFANIITAHTYQTLEVEA